MLFKLIHIGVLKTQSRTRQFKTQMLNSIAWTVLLIMMSYTIIHFIVKDDLFILWTYLPYSTTSILILVCNHLKKYTITEYVINILFPISFIGSAVFLGHAYHTEYLLFLTGMGTIFIFDKPQYQYHFLTFNVITFIAIKIYYLYSPNGIVTLNPNLTPIYSLANGLICFLMIYIIPYITFRYNRKLYRKLQKLTANQEIIIKARTSEIEEKSKALEQYNQELKRFSYISAHDLREPLRSIMSFAQLLSRRINPLNDQHAHEYLGFIQKSIKRMDTITTDIVTYTELEEHITQTALVNCHKIVLSIFETFHQKCPHTALTTQQLPTVWMSPKLCYDLFFNLIQNAIQHNDKPIAKVHVSYEVKESFYQFAIRDNGVGIAPEYFDKIFGMFKRLHNDIEKSGSGIGLAVCKKIVVAYGGEIWVESEKGVGSVFYVMLPYSPHTTN